MCVCIYIYIYRERYLCTYIKHKHTYHKHNNSVRVHLVLGAQAQDLRDRRAVRQGVARVIGLMVRVRVTVKENSLTVEGNPLL